MTNIIVAFSRQEDAKSIKNILMKSGFPVKAVCTSGSHVLSCADELNDGILVCGCRFADMMLDELYDCLPKNFRVLLVASPSQWNFKLPEDVVCLGMPLKVYDLVSTLEMMVQSLIRHKKKRKEQPRSRSKKDQELIGQAKAVLMERNNMTETEAHHYIQKCSMDSGITIVETAKMMISLSKI